MMRDKVQDAHATVTVRQLTITTREYVRNLLLDALRQNLAEHISEEEELLRLASHAELKLLRASYTKSSMLQKAARAVQDLKRLSSPFQLEWLSNDGTIALPVPTSPAPVHVAESELQPAHQGPEQEADPEELEEELEQTPYQPPPAVTMFFERTDIVEAKPIEYTFPVDDSG
jgi:hypothetical protein